MRMRICKPAWLQRLMRQHLIASSVLIAGAETTATALCGIVFFLCNSPIAMQTLVSEVHSAFASEGDITFQSTSKLSYLNAVIEEGLRLYPPVASGLSRLPPPGGAYVDGHFVPEGVRLHAVKVPISLTTSRRTFTLTTTPPTAHLATSPSLMTSSRSAGSAPISVLRMISWMPYTHSVLVHEAA